MVRCFEGETADLVWCVGARALLSGPDTVEQDSQHGATRELLRASFHIEDPRNRWVLSRQPGINPAFAIAEIFWILAGRDDARFITFWNSKYSEYAGTDTHLHGAYGYRLRQQFGLDQLERAFLALQSSPDSRQIVLSIWDGRSDLPSADGSPVSRDVPCNICSLLKIRNGRLEWTQVMRSNDLFLGTPYNFIQFTTLQEVLAGWLDVELGSYFHLSDSLHAYETYEGTRERFSIADQPAQVANSDRLGLPKSVFDVTLERVVEILERFAMPDLSNVQFRALTAIDDLPVGYRNLVLIAAADAARRRKWYTEVDHSLSRCDNPMLIAAWENWRSHYAARRLGDSGSA